MYDRELSTVRNLSRSDLETLVVRAAIQIRQNKREATANGTFLAILGGFLVGTLVAASGFIFGGALN